MEEAFWAAAINAVAGWCMKGVRKVFKKKPLSIEEIKKLTQVLFVDDEPFTYMLDNIRTAGWNAKQIKDIDNLDAEEIKAADIIFMDYKNVGSRLTPTEEGIGLLKALRSKYPSKHLIFYSGYVGFIPGHEFHDIANGWIQKNSDPFVYIERIEAAARKIYGSK